MPILYLVTAPPPVMEGTDAVLEEVAALRAAFGGELVNLFPLSRPTSLVPPQLYGWHKLAVLRELERSCKLAHLFYSLPYPLPVLRALCKPVVQTVTGSVNKNNKPKPKSLAALKRLERIVVSTDREAAILQEWGLSNYAVIHPGIEMDRFVPHLLPLRTELTLLSASAPWVERQFALKGIDALIAFAAQCSNVRIIFLWRGSLVEALQARIRRFSIADRVEIVNSKVDVRDYLRKAHATVLLAKSGDIIKSVPRSLMESLLGGKPVIISDTLAMADMIRRHDVGIVVDAVDMPSLAAAVDKLRQRYDELARNVAIFPRERFSIASMVENYRHCYGLR